ncbi:hypothetical protein PTKIN_Ptkin06aG0090400 [Pterospermum kingtungense]
MEVEMDCKTCGSNLETWFHMFFECPIVVKTWNIVASVVSDIALGIQQNGVFWDEFMKVCFDKNILELVRYTCWTVWKNRNECVFQHTCKSPSSLVFSSKMLQVEYMSKNLSRYPNLDSNPVTWQPFIEGFIKVNVDDAWNVHNKTTVIATVVRDHVGTVLYCSSRRFFGIESMLHAKLLAIKGV